jgi:hypothetical protein
MVLLPYDHGSPHLLWRDGKTAVISGAASGSLYSFGVCLSSEYALDPQGQPQNPRATYPSPVTLNLEEARQAADAGLYKLSKKAVGR